MPTTNHGDIELVAGDAWCIVGTLLDKGGNPLDLTNALIAWTLLDPRGTPVRVGAVITVLDPPTVGIINVTAAVAPGRYTDALRITLAGKTSTFRGGLIFVDANPFTRG